MGLADVAAAVNVTAVPVTETPAISESVVVSVGACSGIRTALAQAYGLSDIPCGNVFRAVSRCQAIALRIPCHGAMSSDDSDFLECYGAAGSLSFCKAPAQVLLAQVVMVYVRCARPLFGTSSSCRPLQAQPPAVNDTAKAQDGDLEMLEAVRFWLVAAPVGGLLAKHCMSFIGL